MRGARYARKSRSLCRSKLALAIAIVGLALVLFAGLTACAGPGYYAQAVSGHFNLMTHRRPVSEVLQDPSTDPQQASRLAEALDIRRFAIDQLFLPDTESYESYVETGREAVSWNVVATPEFALKPRRWCFPVAGCVPYRGYFDRRDAEDFASVMADKGLDVAISPVTAYSTLGWFDDPLLDTMLRYDRVQLAAVMIHEMAHQQLYLPGDTTFSESYAGFVEATGVELWLQAQGDEHERQQWRQSQRAAEQIDGLLSRTRDELARLFSSDLAKPALRAEKAQIYATARMRYQELVRTEWQGRDRYAAWFRPSLNNARLALFDSYRGGNCAFATLFREAGQDMRRFQVLAEQHAALPDDQRKEWLQQSCAAVASRDDL